MCKDRRADKMGGGGMGKRETIWQIFEVIQGQKFPLKNIWAMWTYRTQEATSQGKHFQKTSPWNSS